MRASCVLRCGGASRPRLLQAGERTGAEMVKALRAAVRASGAEVREVDPSPRAGAARRRLGRDARAERQRRAGRPAGGAVVLAAGGGLRGEADALGVGSTNHPERPPRSCGWRWSWGRRAGRSTPGSATQQAGLARGAGGVRAPGDTRGYGATLHDAEGERFVDELAPRDVVAQGIIDAVAAGRGAAAPDGQVGVWLDTPAIDRENGAGFTADRLAYVHNRYLKAGVDITRERVLVYPVLHYRNGACDRRARGDHASGPARRGRDRRRRARLQPPDGQLAARHGRLQAPRRASAAEAAA